MAREVLSEDDLLELMNKELSNFGIHHDCWFTGIQRLQSVDEHGCNWSHAGSQCSDQVADACWPVANRVERFAKARYNLAD